MAGQNRPRFSLLLVIGGSLAVMLLAVLPGTLRPVLGQTAGPASGPMLRCSYAGGSAVTVMAAVCPFGSLPVAGTSPTASAAGASSGSFSSIAFGGAPPSSSNSMSASTSQPGANGALSFGGNAANSTVPTPSGSASPFGGGSQGSASSVLPPPGLAFAFQGLNQNVAGSASVSVVTPPPMTPFPSFFQFSATTTALCADVSKSCTATANVARISFAAGREADPFLDRLRFGRAAGPEDGQQLQAGSVSFPAGSLCGGNGSAVVRLTVSNEDQPLSAVVDGNCDDALEAGAPVLAFQAPVTVCVTVVQDILDSFAASAEGSLVLLDNAGDVLPNSSFDGVQICGSAAAAGTYRVGASE